MKKNTKKKSTPGATALVVCGIALIIVAVVFFLVFMLNGETKVTGEYPDQEKSSSLGCEISNSTYFLFEEIQPVSSNTKVNMVFSNDKLASASIIYTAVYRNEAQAAQAEPVMVSSLNKSLGADFGYNGLGTNFSTNKNTTRMSLTASVSEMDTKGKRYFLLDGSPDGFQSYQEYFEKQGFKCQTNN